MKQRSNGRHLQVAPEPSTVTEDVDPLVIAYRAGREDAFAHQVDIRYAVLAGLNDLEAMSLEELDVLFGLVGGLIADKRDRRHGLRLVDDTADLDAIVAVALSEVRDEDGMVSA